MSDTGDGGQSDGRLPFELEEELPAPEVSPVVAKPPPTKASPPPPRGAARERPTEPPDEGPLAFLDERRKKRLTFYVPLMLVLFVIVGYFFAGGRGLGWFALAGVSVGAFAAWRRRSEVLLGSVAGAAGFLVSMIVAQFPLLFVIVSMGTIGFLTALDESLRHG